MDRLTLCFPGYQGCSIGFTEAHRRNDEGRALVEELSRLGIHCLPEVTPECQACLCGSIWLTETAGEQALAAGVPLIHYCWDLYPWQLEGTYPGAWKSHLWQPYLQQLRQCVEVWVPSVCTQKRVQQFAHTDAHVILSAVHPWTHEVSDQGYIVDVMRPYPDPLCGSVAQACKELDLPCVETQAALPWGEYQKTISGATLLVSAYDEASTGGLSLLEGYYLGKPVLISDSPWLGASDYFGDRAAYFHAGDRDHLREQIRRLYEDRRTPDPASLRVARNWVETTYSNAAMAARMVRRLQEVL